MLENICLGFCECHIPDDLWPRLYRRFVDDTFALLDTHDGAFAFLRCLNALHPSFQFTMESEDDGMLLFMAARVRKEDKVFTTAIYRTPTFTGFFTCGGTVMVPLAKRSPLFAHLCNGQGRSAPRNISIHRATIEALPDCKAVCTFTTCRLFNTCKKDVLPVHVSRIRMEGRYNALKNGSSCTFLRP